jgi:hypothetical protein
VKDCPRAASGYKDIQMVIKDGARTWKFLGSLGGHFGDQFDAIVACHTDDRYL